MDIEDVKRRGLVLLGCGKMGSAMLAGWLKGGVPAQSVWVIDPKPSDWLLAQGVHLNEGLPDSPAVAVIAVKPQVMEEALPDVGALGGGDTLVISVAAGTTMATFERVIGPATPVVRAMPNTPAAVGRGITAICGNRNTGNEHLSLAESLLSAVGGVERVEGEGQMAAVTALSGSGPAYVFLMIEAMAAAGQRLGLPDDLSLRLARATVAGAGHLAMEAEETPDVLRRNVTSPNGTTQAALDVLMGEGGFGPLMMRAMQAAARRAEELANG